MNTKTNDLLARFGASVLECLAQASEWSAETLDAIAGEAYALKLARSGENSEFVVCAPAPTVEVLSPANEKRGAVLLVNGKREDACYSCGGPESVHVGGKCPAPVWSGSVSPVITAAEAYGAEARERAAVGMGAAAAASNEAGRAPRVAPGIFPGETSGALLLVFHDGSEVFAIDLIHSQEDAKARAEESAHDTGGNVSCSIIPLSLALAAAGLRDALKRLSDCPDVLLDNVERETELALHQAWAALGAAPVSAPVPSGWASVDV